jgi:hypothetical protein
MASFRRVHDHGGGGRHGGSDGRCGAILPKLAALLQLEERETADSFIEGVGRRQRIHHVPLGDELLGGRGWSDRGIHMSKTNSSRGIEEARDLSNDIEDSVA